MRHPIFLFLFFKPLEADQFTKMGDPESLVVPLSAQQVNL